MARLPTPPSPFQEPDLPRRPAPPAALPRGFLPGVLLVSAAMLWLETLLPRVFAVHMAPNFVFFSVSIALVGLASGGIALWLWEERFVPGGARRLADLALGFAVATVLAAWIFALLGGWLNVTIDGIYAEVLGRAYEGEVLTTRILLPSMAFVLAAGLVMAVPFFFAGATIALAFRLAPGRAGAVYGADLVGAGIGCALTVAALSWTSAPRAILAVGTLGAVAALVFLAGSAEPSAGRRWRHLAAVGVAAVLALLAIRPPFDFDVHRYAYLRSYYATPLVELDHRWTPLGRVALAEREWVPPLNPEPEMRPLTFVGMDLGGLAVVETFSPENLAEIRGTSVFTDEIMEPIAVPAMAGDVDDVLVLMAGTGQDLLRAYAWYGDSTRLTGVELNPAVFGLGLAHPTANLEAFFEKPNVSMAIGDGRTFVERAGGAWDVIFLSYSGATFASGTGVISSTPQFLMTKEAFVAYLEALEPGGVLIAAESSAAPEALPRTLRTFAAALEAWRPDADLSKHLIAYTRPGIHDDRNYTLFHRDPLSRGDVERIEGALADHDLVLTWSPHTEPAYPALERFVERWRSTGRVEPDDVPSWLGLARSASQRVHTDAHPFFYFDLGPDEPGEFLVVGYVGMTLVALIVAGVFLAAPLVVARRRRNAAGGGAGPGDPADPGDPGDRAGPGRFFHLAFALLGLGFMLVEVGAIQRFELFLGDPTLSLVVILAALLIFAGLGGHLSRGWFEAGRLTVPRVALGIVGYGLVLLWVLSEGIYALLGWPLGAKIAAISALLLPLGLLLGSLFPWLLDRLAGGRERYVPWAIAINGIFSVVAANVGVLIYLFFGANVVMGLGLACYAALGAAAASRPARADA